MIERVEAVSTCTNCHCDSGECVVKGLMLIFDQIVGRVWSNIPFILVYY